MIQEISTQEMLEMYVHFYFETTQNFNRVGNNKKKRILFVSFQNMIGNAFFFKFPEQFLANTLR